MSASLAFAGSSNLLERTRATASSPSTAWSDGNKEIAIGGLASYSGVAIIVLCGLSQPGRLATSTARKSFLVLVIGWEVKYPAADRNRAECCAAGMRWFEADSFS